MSVERDYEGKSSDGNLQEALNKALESLVRDLAEDGVRDASASWVITEINGNYGGFAGSRTLKVRIAAKRTPEWGTT